MTMRFYKYTPALLDPKTLEDTLIGRDAELDNLKRILKSASSGKSFSHAILIGPKGIGKSHLLRILYHSVRGEIKTKELNVFKNKFTPVIFSEEEYPGNITKCFKLILQYLSESGIEDIPPIPQDLMKAATLNVKEKELAIDYIKTFRKKSGKILLLLADNLNDIIERFTDEDQSTLREVLMTSDSILLIGAAPTLFDSIINHGRPLYNFFEIIWLKDLSFEDTISLLHRYAKLEERDDLIDKLKKEEAKLRAIHELAGGNPRLILSLYHIIVEGDITSVENTFLKLLDELSPYFRERMKDLSEQQKEIIDVMARAEGLLTPTEIAGRCYMPVNVVLSQIKRLERAGYIRISKKHAKKVFYDFNERLFSLWRQMRVEAGRKRLGFIVKFLELWFTKEELLGFIDKTLDALRYKLQYNYEGIQHDMNKLWYLKEAISEFKGGDEIFVACQRKDYDIALKIIKEELKSKPTNVDKLYQQGCIFNKQKLYDKAVQAYKKAIEIEPNKYMLWYSLGDTYANLSLNNKAIDAYKKTLEINPNLYEALNNLGIIYSKLNRYDEAIDIYKKAILITPDRYEALNNLGSLYSKLKRYDKAIDVYKKTILIKPDLFNALYNLGTIYAELKRYDEAEDAYKKAIVFQPDSYKTLNNLGNTYSELNRYAEAEDVYKKATALKPDRYEALYNIGIMYSKLKQYYQAINVYKKALEINPEVNRVLNKLIDTLLTVFVEEGTKGNIDSSVKNMKEALIYFKNLKNIEEGINTFISAFRNIIQEKKLDVLKMGITEIEKSKQSELLKALSPFSNFIKYLETRDPEIIDRLRHEERIIVEDMIKMVEGKSNAGTKDRKAKPIKKKTKI
ncbi:MAG: tetratricopeptide repeat protein [Nitrospiraceae bacterium]|nr:MAG: tetratricopeptide repeat protein [Nitrospiraceae bacterium]